MTVKKAFNSHKSGDFDSACTSFVELKSYGDPVKSRVRREFRRFQDKNLSTPPEETIVLCLPGHEEYEITEIYDARGIPRKNVYGCENNLEAYKRQKNLNLGINFYYTDIETYLKYTNKGFHSINLDFTGPIQDKYLRCAQLIFERELLEDNGIIGLTYLAKRESGENKELLAGLTMEIYTKLLKILTGKIGLKEKQEQIKIIVKDFKSSPIQVLRSYVDELFAAQALNVKLREMDEELKNSIRFANLRLSEFERRSILEKAGNYFKDAYVVKECERLSYVSDHSPMRAVFYQFERNQNKAGINSLTSALSKLNRCCVGSIKKILPPQATEEPEKQYPPRKVASAEKKHIYEEIEKLTDGEYEKERLTIARKHRISPYQLSAFKAWVTMTKEKEGEHEAII